MCLYSTEQLLVHLGGQAGLSAWGAAWGAQRYWNMMLPEILEKDRAKETQCQICGKTISAKTAIIRENEVLCEECYAKKYISKQPIQERAKV